jgi:hypothetical protein
MGLAMGLRATWVLTALLCIGTVSCSPAIALGVSAALVGGAALAARCSDPVHVAVFDGVTGLRACDAKVVAVSPEGSEETFSSCFYAALPAGSWTVRAERRGYQSASTSFVIRSQQRCDPAVQTIELSLFPMGAAKSPGVPIRPLRPDEAPLTPGALPTPASIGVETAAPPSPNVSPTTPTTPPPASASAPPVAPAPPAPIPSAAPGGAPSASPSATAPTPSSSPPSVSF